ncbi:hypothetical protein TNCV_4253361 [Trichonephila clavipes]|nr:hypothetical protein TNCV_4253361 [Trichonephila clavipes]
MLSDTIESVMFLHHTAEISASFCVQYNTVPMHTCNPKYCRVLSSDIAMATYDRKLNPTAGHTCESETPSVIRGVKTKPPHSKTMEWKEIP